MSKSKIEEVVDRENSFRTLFGPDIEVILQFTGLYSISSVIAGEFYRPNFLEILPLIVGVVAITTMLTCQYLSVYRYWTSDKDYVLNVFTISFETVLVLVKVNIVKSFKNYLWWKILVIKYYKYSRIKNYNRKCSFRTKRSIRISNTSI